MSAAEVGSAYFSLLPSVKGLQGAIAKEVANVDGKSAGEHIGAGMGGGIAGKLKELVGPALAVFAADRIKDFAKESVASFSELEDSTAAAGVVFGTNMDQIISQSKTAGATLGMSSQQVINAANTFGTYGKAAGLTGGDLAGFSTKLTGLAGDMASFKGTSTEQAIEAVGAALRGETEPIRAYGVMLDDASLRQEAMSQGLISTTKDALTPQQKVLAAQALIFKQTTDAQGDYARTSLSTANVAKTLSAETENLHAKIGGFLAPAFTAVRIKAVEGVRGISGFLDKVTEAQETAKNGGTNLAIMQSLFGVNSRLAAPFAEALGPMTAFYSAAKSGGEVTSSGIAGSFEGAGIKVHDSFARLKTLGPDIAAGFTLPAGEIKAIGSDMDPIVGIGVKLHEVFSKVGEAVGPSLQALGPVFSQLAPVFSGLLPQVLQLWSAFSPLQLVFNALLPVLPSLIGAFGSFAGAVGGTLGGILTAVMPVLQQLSMILVDSLGKLFVAMAPVIVTLLGQLGSYFQQLAPVITQIVTVVVQLVGQLLSALMPIILQLVSTVMPMVVTIFGAVLQAIVPLITMLASLLIPIIQALLPVVVVVFGVIADVIGNVMQIVMGIIQVVTGIISGNWAQVWDGILNIVSGVFGLVLSLISGAIQFLISIVAGGLNAVFGFFSAIFSGIVNYLATSWSSIINGAGGMIGSLLGFFGGLGGKIMGALGDIGRTLFGAGRDIIQGLINGIGSMMGAIGNAIVSIVPGPIVGVFKDLLGIHSPSRVFYGFGVNTFEGYINAVGDMEPKVAEAVAKTGRAALQKPPSFTAFGANASYDATQGNYSFGGGGPLVQQNVYPSEKMSENNLASIAASKIVGALV